MQNLPASSKTIKTIEDLTEVMSMWETRTKKWEESILEKGIEQGVERGMERGMEKRDLEITERMISNGMSNSDIRKTTGISLNKIERIRKHKRSR